MASFKETASVLTSFSAASSMVALQELAVSVMPGYVGGAQQHVFQGQDGYKNLGNCDNVWWQ